MKKWYVLGGVEVWPDVNKPIQAGRAFVETLKLFSNMTDPKTIVNFTEFTSLSSVVWDARSKGTLSVDLKRYGDANLSLTGMPTAASTTPSVLEIKSNDAGFEATRCDTFAICDVIYKLDQSGSFSSVY